MRGSSGKRASTVSDVTEINSGMGVPSSGGSTGIWMVNRPASVFAAGRQRRRSIVAAFCGRQAWIASGVLTRHEARALEPRAAALPSGSPHVIFSVTSGKAKNARSNAGRVERAAAAIEGCREQRTTVLIGLQDPQLDAFSRRRDPEMVAHRHLDEGRDVEQFVLALPHAGIADVSRAAPAARKDGSRQTCCALRR